MNAEGGRGQSCVKQTVGGVESSSRAFVSALEAQDASSLRSIPKADLHAHGCLSLSRGRLCALIGEKRLSPPPPAFSGLPDFSRWIRRIGPFARHPDWAPWFLDAACASAADDGVKVLELSFDSATIRAFPRVGDFLAIVDRLFRKWAPVLRLKPEIGFKKAENPEESGELLEALIGSGLFRSIDLYGPELPPWLWVPRWKGTYRKARAAGLKLKAHLGEAEGPLGLLSAAQGLDLDAVQHGASFARSRRLRDWAREKDATLNLCPASNLALGLYTDLKAHPLKALFDSGLRVTVNTDDLLAFGSTAGDQFLALAREGVLSPAELDRIRIYGLEEGARG